MFLRARSLNCLNSLNTLNSLFFSGLENNSVTFFYLHCYNTVNKIMCIKKHKPNSKKTYIVIT